MYNNRKYNGRYKPLQMQKLLVKIPWLYSWEWAILFGLAISALFLALI